MICNEESALVGESDRLLKHLLEHAVLHLFHIGRHDANCCGGLRYFEERLWLGLDSGNGKDGLYI